MTGSLQTAFDNRMIVTPGGKMFSTNSRETRLNSHCAVLGGSGSGKTRCFGIQNVVACPDSLIVSDPKGTLTKECADIKRQQGFDVWVLDLIHPEQSAHYNPMDYIRSSDDIRKLAHEIVFSQGNCYGSDVFWPQSAELTMDTMISILSDIQKLKTACPQLGEAEHTNRSLKFPIMNSFWNLPFSINSVFELLRDIDPIQIAAGNDCRLDKRVRMLASTWTQTFGTEPCRSQAQWSKFNQLSEKTLSCILMVLHGILAEMDSDGIREMMSKSDFDLADIGRKPTVVFVQTSDTDRSKDMVANLFYAQTMNMLCELADRQPDGKLPCPTRFILDDFGTNCKIANFDKIISNIRSREIAAMILFQSQSQLFDCYGDSAHTILQNCDTLFYLGGNDPDTAEMIARRCNKPMHKILNMPVGTHWMFRRGMIPQHMKTVDYDDYCKSQKYEPSLSSDHLR